MSLQTIQSEAEAIADFYGRDKVAAMGLIERQLNAIHSRAQIILGFSAVAITTTGFSGRLIAGTNVAAQVCVIAGLATILLSCFYLFQKVLAVEWVMSRLLKNDLVQSLAELLVFRDRKTLAYERGSKGILVGLGFYAIAIALMLLNPYPLNIPVR